MSIHVAEQQKQVPVRIVITTRQFERLEYRHASNRVVADGVFEFTTPDAAYIFPLDVIGSIVSTADDE